MNSLWNVKANMIVKHTENKKKMKEKAEEDMNKQYDYIKCIVREFKNIETIKCICIKYVIKINKNIDKK